jgi:hypothetical protein
MKTLYALDLMETLDAKPLRNERERSVRTPTNNHSHFPRDDFASPLGFRFADDLSGLTPLAPLRVEIVGRDEPDRGAGECERRNSEETAKHQRSGAKLELAGEGVRGTGSPLLLYLEIDANTARVEVDAEVWSSVSETVLLVVAQFWRFHAIDRALDELTEWAHGDLENGELLSLIRRRRTRELHERRRKLQALILDLPDFERLLTNPRAHLARGRPVRIYRALSAQLGLGRWRRAIDERVEVVEAVFDSLAESLNHLQGMVSQIVLELVIVAVLLLDVGLYLLDAVAR